MELLNYKIKLCFLNVLHNLQYSTIHSTPPTPLTHQPIGIIIIHIIRLPTSVARPAGAGYFNNIFLKI